jgi:ParB-like chromosome segregation protein Spo0J
VSRSDASALQSAHGSRVARRTGAPRDHGRVREVVTIPLIALHSGESPRLEGESQAHIAWLAETDAVLPPILVDRRSMKVIDGMHRLLAASLRGRETIDVEFYDGSPTDAFLRAVEANVTHGLPLSQADRRAAARRIVTSHPQLSDRSIGESTGLAARTVATIRRSTDAVPQLNTRMGRDGRVRPLNGLAGRRRAAELLAERPRASLREVARAAGVSPATARDVRRRLEQGEDPARPGPSPAAAANGTANGTANPAPAAPGETGRRARRVSRIEPSLVLEKLLRDPSLRHNEEGRWLLRLLKFNAVSAQKWSEAITRIPPHSAAQVVQLARLYAQMWLRFAQELEERARIVDPWASRSANGRG